MRHDVGRASAHLPKKTNLSERPQIQRPLVPNQFVSRREMCARLQSKREGLVLSLELPSSHCTNTHRDVIASVERPPLLVRIDDVGLASEGPQLVASRKPFMELAEFTTPDWQEMAVEFRRFETNPCLNY